MAKQKGLTLLFIGDSLTEYFDWQRRFPGHTIINGGKAAETVDGLWYRIERIISGGYKPNAVFVMTGINNIAMEETDFLDIYRSVLGVLKRTYPHARIVVQSILPTRLSWIRNSTIQKINRELKQIAEREGMEYLDLYQRFVDSSGEPFPKCFDPDGIHLGKAGYDIWSEVIAEYIAYLPGK